MMRIIKIVVFVLCCLQLIGQQVPDSTYNPPILNPAYALNEGSHIYIDEAHYNFHTLNGRYRSFADLLERDGYVLKSFTEKFTEESLEKVDILVISNALNELNERDWYLPNPSAFTNKEIIALEHWVKNGGRLFLIADHMPIAGAAIDLAASFGFEFTNGFVFHKTEQGPAFFTHDNKGLLKTTITEGRNESEKVSSIATFTGQAFQIPEKAKGILQFDNNYINMLPDTAWVFNANTKRLETDGWYQGAFMEYGEGRLVAFGEAAMFSAQLAGPQKRKMGMNNEVAPQNHQLLLNIIHWLDGIF